jgi:hypothetical protein
LQQLVAEHRKLLTYLEAHLAAMKKLDRKAMDESASLQEASRVRIAILENRRRSMTAQLGKMMRMEGDLTISRIASAFPAKAQALTSLRTELKTVMQAVQSKAFVASRVAGAVLGHLNTAVRLLAGAVEKAGVYTKHGVPKVSARIGVMEAVG